MAEEDLELCVTQYYIGFMAIFVIRFYLASWLLLVNYGAFLYTFPLESCETSNALVGPALYYGA